MWKVQEARLTRLFTGHFTKMDDLFEFVLHLYEHLCFIYGEDLLSNVPSDRGMGKVDHSSHIQNKH